MEIINNKYRIENVQLGKGGFSKVYLGTRIEDDQRIAIKIVPLQHKNLKANDMINKLNFEIEVMKNLNHPNIIKFYDAVKTDKHWFIITEYCNYGTLDNVIKYNEKMSKSKSINFNREENTYYYLNQLKDALIYLRNLGYIHRDIKPTNVLLNKLSDLNETGETGFNESNKSYHLNNNLIVKLSDFGLAKEYQISENKLMETICGSPLYMAPELFINKKYDSQADLWSFGIIMYQMLFGVNPIIAESLPQLVQNLKSKKIDFNLNKNFTNECFDLLKRLLSRNPEERINWETFFNHNWFDYWNKIGSLPTLHKKENLSDTHHQRIQSEPIKIIQSKIFDSSENIKSSFGSPLGSSNLSKMKMDGLYSSNVVQKKYTDYPASYPPSDPRRSTPGSYENSRTGRSYDNSRSRIFKSYHQLFPDKMENSSSSLNESSDKSDILGNSTVNYHFFLDESM